MAATTFYVDGDGNFAASQTGAIDNAFGGPWGLQKSLRTSGAGISYIYAKATSCRLDRLISFGGLVANKTGTWVVGDAVEEDGGSPSWQGVLCEINETTCIIELSSGYYDDVDATGTIKNTTQVDTVSYSSRAGQYIAIDTNIGTAAARLSIIGCKDDAGWTVDGTRFVLDANGVVANGVVANGTGDYWGLVNFELCNATADGLDTVTAQSAGALLENIYAHDCGGSGIDMQYANYCRLVRCRAESNGTYGFYVAYASLVACEATGNVVGLYVVNLAVISSSLIYNNTSDNLYFSGGVAWMAGTIVDGAGRHGIYLNTGVLFCDECRVTNNGNQASEYGLNMASGTVAYLNHCLFTGNRQAGAADGDIGGAGAGGAVKLDLGTGTPGNTNIFDGAATPDDGYTNASGHDFNLTAEARMRSVAYALPDT